MADFPFTSLWLGRALALSGRWDEAIPYLASKPSYAGYLGYTYAVMRRRAEAAALAAARPHDYRSPLRSTAVWAKLLRNEPRPRAIKASLGLPQ